MVPPLPAAEVAVLLLLPKVIACSTLIQRWSHTHHTWAQVGPKSMFWALKVLTTLFFTRPCDNARVKREYTKMFHLPGHHRHCWTHGCAPHPAAPSVPACAPHRSAPAGMHKLRLQKASGRSSCQRVQTLEAAVACTPEACACSGVNETFIATFIELSTERAAVA